MTTKLERADRYIAAANDALEAGFQSEAGRKRALESVGRAYEAVRDFVHDQTIAAAREAIPGWDTPEKIQDYFAWLRERDMPFGVHQVREKHFAALADFPAFEQARDLIALRETIRAATIEKIERDPQVEKVERVRRSLIEEMDARKASFVRGLEVSKMFGGKVSVSVNAHIVYGAKGTRFVRHFFYLYGKLTALNTIIAVADKLEREGAAQ